ncbi:MAG: NAD(P)-dependent alcohol dehydrogenase [Oceanospirillum sp.]|nr:NAD(P)-dependent alcohol dehydrogenase [Oceanospirillum sp.]
MKAVVATRYGPPEVLRIKEVPKPVPKDNQVLVRVCTATVTAGDCELRRFDLAPLYWLPVRLWMGVRRPEQTLGQEMSGIVEEIGSKVTRYRKGDAVIAGSLGSYAEYICLSEKQVLARKPPEISHDHAATLPTGGLNALFFLRKANIQPGQHVLVNGAGGSIGTYGIQLIRKWGGEVTAVDSAPKLNMLRSIGADHVIDYTTKDFTKNGVRYDFIFDIVSRTIRRGSLRSLKPGGCLLLANPSLTGMMASLWTRLTSSKRIKTGLAPYRTEDVEFLMELVKSGELRPVIDRRWPLDQIVEAHRYAETGHKAGNIVIEVNSET